MGKKPCEHKNLSLEVKAIQIARRYGKSKEWDYEVVTVVEGDIKSPTYAYCLDCGKHLTKKERDKMGNP